jgi:hypothetical protein
MLLALVIGYSVLGLVTRALEGAGVYRCGCQADCWCKRPGLSLFRWVLPRWHKTPTSVAWKAEQARRQFG